MGELAQWKSHKIVRAGKILPDQKQLHLGIITVEDANGAPCDVDFPPDMFARSAPKADDYLVIYDDGYKSWSPRSAFEGGYSRVPI